MDICSSKITQNGLIREFIFEGAGLALGCKGCLLIIYQTYHPEMSTRILLVGEDGIVFSLKSCDTKWSSLLSLLNKRVTAKEIKVSSRHFPFIFIFNEPLVEILHHLAQIRIIQHQYCPSKFDTILRE